MIDLKLLTIASGRISVLSSGCNRICSKSLVWFTRHTASGLLTIPMRRVFSNWPDTLQPCYRDQSHALDRLFGRLNRQCSPAVTPEILSQLVFELPRISTSMLPRLPATGLSWLSIAYVLSHWFGYGSHAHRHADQSPCIFTSVLVASGRITRLFHWLQVEIIAVLSSLVCFLNHCQFG